jgi:hypothetical protein
MFIEALRDAASLSYQRAAMTRKTNRLVVEYRISQTRLRIGFVDGILQPQQAKPAAVPLDVRKG